MSSWLAPALLFRAVESSKYAFVAGSLAENAGILIAQQAQQAQM